jgi:hypothetical protein
MPRFRAFKQFNGPSPVSVVASRSTLKPSVAERFFGGDTLHAKIVRSLAEARCLPIKEVVESFEVFERVRKPMRTAVIADLCCGHGLVGLLMAAFERRVEEVHLFDSTIPDNSAQCLAAVARAAPWIDSRIHFHTTSLRRLDEAIPFTSVLATHACGSLTDQSLEIAAERGCPVAATPCCYAKRISQAPPVLVRELGLERAIDTDRTYRLHAAGYHVRWSYIPEPISPMNRVLIASR